MKKTIFLLTGLLFLSNSFLQADEGMWLPVLIKKLNIKKMQEMGLQLSAEEIYSINQSSLKDAIPIFGGGCTSDVISKDGLLLTNYHCGYGRIQSHSTMENDYLKHGFWARTKEEELTNPGLSVTFLVRMEDVTDRINAKLNEKMTERERGDTIRKVSQELQKEATEGTHYESRVRNFFGGNQFYLLVFERYKDVRLVGAPPVSIGDFGSLTDNWMWPRHKADFCLFRIYMSPDGKPAEYAPGNIPYKPKHYLPVSIKGANNGDFAMILGYPGRTTRYMTSFGVKELMEITHPNRIKIRGKKLELMNTDMNADPAIRLKYAAKYKGSSNSWKYSIGQIRELKRMNVLIKKQETEDRFLKWLSEDDKRKEKYGQVLEIIEKVYTERRKYAYANQYIYESLLGGSEIISFTTQMNQLYRLLEDDHENKEEIDKIVSRLKSRAERHFKDYHLPTDKKITIAMFEYFIKDAPKEFHPASFSIIEKKYKGDLGKFSDDLFTKSIFADKARFNEFLNKPELKSLTKDLAFKMTEPIMTKLTEIGLKYRTISEDLRKSQRLFIAGLMEMEKDRVFYPDANSTMRLTYGTVSDYSARDAVVYKHYTTLKGVMEKEDTDNYEFIVPPKLKELYENKDYGRYGKNGTMPVCFITNNDITGGNSGSPVIGANGELIGLTFDGNWEGMSGDIAFEPEFQKTICVDARYILFIIDKFAGASHLIEEMTVIE